MSEAANRLHHLSMRYSGALIELLAGAPVGIVPSGRPGLRESRDLIDLILLTRAEINGLTRILVDAGVVSESRAREVMETEYDWLAKVKAEFLGVQVTDFGLSIRPAAGGVQ
jgi:hypothetical protein